MQRAARRRSRQVLRRSATMSATLIDAAATRAALSLEEVDAVPLPRGALPRRQGVGWLARALPSRGRVLDAGLGRRRQAGRGPADRDLADLVRPQGRPRGPRVPHPDRALSATSLPEPRTSHNISNVEILSQDGGECRLRFNWVTFSYPLQDDRHLFRHVLLHARHQRPAAADQAQEDRAEERLHPPRRRHLPHLIAT